MTKVKIMGLAVAMVLLATGCSSKKIELKKDSSEGIAKKISSISKENGISPIDAYYVIMLESGFEPISLSMYTRESVSKLKKRFTRSTMPGIKKSSVHKDLTMFHFKSEALAYSFIDDLGWNTQYSVGLMGVPSSDYYLWEKDTFFNPSENIKKGIERMRQCGDKYTDSKEQIECLNKLSNEDYKKFDYWRAFKKVSQ